MPAHLRSARRPVTLLFARRPDLAAVREALVERRTAAWLDDDVWGEEQWLRAIWEGAVQAPAAAAPPHGARERILPSRSRTPSAIDFDVEVESAPAWLRVSRVTSAPLCDGAAAWTGARDCAGRTSAVALGVRVRNLHVRPDAQLRGRSRCARWSIADRGCPGRCRNSASNLPAGRIRRTAAGHVVYSLRTSALLSPAANPAFSSHRSTFPQESNAARRAFCHGDPAPPALLVSRLSRWSGGASRGGREAAARRAAEHRAARGACAGARGQLHRRSRPAPPRPRHVSRGSRTTCACCAPPTARWPTTCATGQFVTAGGRVAARQLPPGHRRRSPTSGGTCRARYYRQLPTLASREHAGAGARLRDGRRADPPQRQPARSPAADPVPQQLPARRAADDRRAVGVAEHAEAGAHREPAPPRRRDCWPRAPRARAADGYVARADARPAARRRAAGRRRHRVHRPAAASRPRVRAPAVGDRAAPSTTHLAARQTTAEDTIRGEHQRQAVAQVSVANAITSLRLCATLDWQRVRRGGQPGRAGAAARSRRRLRPHGLPQPRSAAPGGRGAGRAERRSAGARRAEGGRERAPGGGAAARPADRAAHVGYHLIDRGPRAISKPTSPIGPTLAASARARAPVAHATGALPRRRSRVADRAAGRRRRSPTRGSAGGSPAVQLARGAARAAAGERPRDRVRPAAGRPRRRPAAAAAPRLLRRRARRRPDDGRRPDAADERRRRRRAARAPRGAGARQPRSAHPLRDPQRLRRRDRRATLPDDEAILDARARRASRRSTSAFGAEPRRPLLPVPPRPAVERAASRRGWAGSASAARSRSSTACCAAPPTRASRRRSATLDVLPLGPLLHHARLRHAPAARRRASS